MGECKTWCPSLHEIWISDFNLVWGEVPGAKFLCSQMRMDQKKEQTNEWSIYRASQELQDAWDEKWVRNGMRTGARTTIVKAAFAVEPTFDEEATEEIEGSKQPTTEMEEFSETAENPKKRRRTTSNEMESSNKRKPCWVCDGNHGARTCFLALGNIPKRVKIPEENEEVFERRMADPLFAEKILRIRELEEERRKILDQDE
jgi:hypothetical protein